MKDKLIRFTVDDDLKGKFKQYCADRDTTMSNVLIDYITTLLPENAEILPGEEKNAVDRTALTKLFHCPYCGMDITSASGPDRLFHLQNCRNSQNE